MCYGHFEIIKDNVSGNQEHSNFDWMLFFGILEESYDIT